MLYYIFIQLIIGTGSYIYNKECYIRARYTLFIYHLCICVYIYSLYSYMSGIIKPFRIYHRCLCCSFLLCLELSVAQSGECPHRVLPYGPKNKQVAIPSRQDDAKTRGKPRVTRSMHHPPRSGTTHVFSAAARYIGNVARSNILRFMCPTLFCLSSAWSRSGNWIMSCRCRGAETQRPVSPYPRVLTGCPQWFPHNIRPVRGKSRRSGGCENRASPMPKCCRRDIGV